MRMLILLFCLALGTPVLAASADLAPATRAFDDGAFSRAAFLARKLDTSQGDAFAARAELVQGEFVSVGAGRRAAFDRALADARRAILRDPARPEGHLYLAVALGLVARGEGVLMAHLAGYGDEARAHIDRALALAPDNAWAHAALGGWHLEIAYAGGLVGAALYGASVEAGEASYERALALDPGNISIAWQYAFQLAGIGGKSRIDRAQALLAAILEHPPQTALDRFLRDGAAELAAAVESRNRPEMLRVVTRRLGRDGFGATAPGPRLETRPSVGRTR